MNGFRSQYEYLQEIIVKNEIDIICLQETNLKNTDTIKIKNFTCYNKNRTECLAASGGVAILIKDNIYSTNITLNSNVEAVAVAVTIGTRSLTICNVYLSNRYELTYESLDNLKNQLPPPYVILGDFNSHSTMWGSCKLDNRGKIVEEFIINNDIVLLNDKTHTYFNTYKGTSSAIDLSLCSSALIIDFDWEVLDNLYGSDHYPLMLKFNQPIEKPIRLSQKWKFQDANWEKYKQNVTLNIQNLDIYIENSTQNNTVDIDEIINKFTEIIIDSANVSIPKTNEGKKKKIIPWWNAECENAIRNAKKALNTYKRENTLRNRIEFKKQKSIAKRIVKDSKKKSWLNYLETINHQTPNKELWKKIKAIEGRPYAPITTLKENGKILNNTSDIANILGQSFANNSSNHNYSKEFQNYKESYNKFQKHNIISAAEDKYESPLNSNLTYNELIKALDNSKNSSPGPDNIPNILLKNLPDIALKTLLYIYNIIWKYRVFPEAWQHAIVVPILKPGKIKFDKNSYRPISLTCCLCKLMEKIINKRLRWYLESENILHKTQSGFRENCSTLDCLVNLETNIREAFSNNHHLIATCLDMEKAYDLVWRNRILERLIQYNIKGNLFFFVKNFLNNRKIRVRIGTTLSDEFTTENGVPQGAVISVTLFLLAINNIQEYILPPVQCTLFADDLTIFIKGSNIKTSQKIMQQTLDNLVLFANTEGFKISISKSQTINFNRKRKKKEEIILKVGNEIIKNVKEVKILGLIFDSRLTWKTHIEALKTQCLTKTNILKSLAAKNWGADQTVLCNTYKAIIQSKIDYASIIYSSASDCILKKLDTVLHTNMRIATGAFVTSPTACILSESKMLPLYLRRKKLTLNYASRIWNNPTNQVFDIIRNIYRNPAETRRKLNTPIYHRIESYLKESSISMPSCFVTSPDTTYYYWLLDETVCNTIISKPSDNSLEYKHQYTDYYHITINTTKTKQAIGAAAILNKQEQILLKFPVFYSQLACIAILIKKVIEHVANTHTKAIIHTNSLKFIKKMQNDIIVQKNIFSELIKEVIDMKGKIILHYLSVEGEFSNAIEMSRQACDLKYNNIPEILTKEDAYKIINSSIMSEWNKQWQNQKYKLREIKPIVNSANPALTFNRRNQVMITRLRIGHTKFTHEYLLNKENRNECTTCNVPISVEHILIHCPQYKKERRDSGLITKDIKEILSNISNCKKVLKFIELCKLQDKIL